MATEIILIAGGSGMIGQSLKNHFLKKGFETRILTRGKSDYQQNLYHWDPIKREIDQQVFKGVTTLVNLSGAGISDKRWTSSRKKELINSRTIPALFLASFAHEMPELQQYISASGINCYGIHESDKIHTESDAFGKDFLSKIVEKWENAADAFLPFCKVAKVRISLVLAKQGGALIKITQPMKYGITNAIGSGQQWMPWIHITDLTHLFDFIRQERLEGPFNATGKAVSNLLFTQTLATALHKKIWLPNIPGFLLKVTVGEMSTLLLDGLNASSEKIKSQGFEFEFEDLKSALENIYS